MWHLELSWQYSEGMEEPPAPLPKMEAAGCSETPAMPQKAWNLSVTERLY
jgi:hypothetical protein